jgi:hypothetical protein
MAKNRKGLEIVDEFFVDLETGSLTSWACAHNELLAGQGFAPGEKLRECPAPQGLCPRGMTKTFECRTLR